MIDTRRATVPSLVEEAGKLGVKAVVVISAGFKKPETEGAKIEAEVSHGRQTPWHASHRPGNCLGIMNPRIFERRLPPSMARPGRVAF